ncbi:MAG TPA: hypothetical protein VGD78_14400 [Chthoniobacterales bacterium]
MTNPIRPVQKTHESSDVPLRRILWGVPLFVATAAVLHLALIGYGRLLAGANPGFGRVYPLGTTAASAYPAPALQANAAVDLQAYRAQAERDLNGTGWIDQAHGTMKIPVDRAMVLLLARGLPVRPPIQDGPTELDLQKQKAAENGAKTAGMPADRIKP